jgi:DNA mismatch endonuclease (patch repair protein)
MADVFSKRKRSAIMARVLGSGNRSTELRMIALFRKHGLAGWRRHSQLTGKPDFVFPRQRLAVFVDGCFWHGCPSHGSLPRSRSEYWEAKISRNRRRDRAVARLLQAKAWRVLRIWEHALDRQNEARTAARLRLALAG